MEKDEERRKEEDCGHHTASKGDRHQEAEIPDWSIGSEEKDQKPCHHTESGHDYWAASGPYGPI